VYFCIDLSQTWEFVSKRPINIVAKWFFLIAILKLPLESKSGKTRLHEEVTIMVDNVCIVKS
jgi:hypothetical protein